ncbi:aldehyde dehydrogenase family protein [Bacillus testis]|uniref:aldehyde dehydrogenase family protein n=1 Tax=Bacillus testis TaxID=1622072 RepID=UPI00067F00CE|nr:aldehyde dehydrogenase family protein [Bacillus testis]
MLHNDWNTLYINGEWRKGNGERTISDTNPYTGEDLATISTANKEDLDEAYHAAARAQQEWNQTLPQVKEEIILKAIAVIEEHHDMLVDWLIKESGSTFKKANGELSTAVAFMKEASRFPYEMEGKINSSQVNGKINAVIVEPIGVVGVISPWNFPFHLTMRSVVAALACGNGVVVKPAGDTPVTGGLLIASIFEEAGLPKGLLNVIAGKGSEIGDDFVKHPIPQMISFTGSTPVGKHIAEGAAEGVKKTALELGGNNVMIVLEDADIENAVESTLMGKFMHQGQVCVALNRVLVQESIAERFTNRLIERVKELKYGDPADSNTHVGPIINPSQVAGIKEKIDKSIEEGAVLAYGGEISGNLIQPTVLTNVKNTMTVAKEEIFGPVLPVITFKDEEEAISMANAYPYGLSGAVHSTIEHGVRVARKVHTGMIHVNDQSINDEPHMPFGGVKQSGLGRFNGKWALEEFTDVKWISIQTGKSDYSNFL